MKHLCLCVFMLLALYSTSSYCIIPVIDESAIVEHVLIAANTLKSTVNEATQIAKQAEAYLQDAKHLVALPQSYVDQVVGLYTQYNEVLGDAKGISYDLKNAVAEFEELYKTGTGNAPMAQRLLAMAQQIRNAGAVGNQASAIFNRLCAQLSTAQQLVDASQLAPGTLAATQATNQLMQVMIDQQGSLQTIQATMGRVQTGYIMRETIMEEHAQSEGQRYMADWPTEKMRAPMEGKGFALP